MTISADLFRAILSMDSYNRGYNAGVNLALNTQIGTASISASSANQTASFFAQSYTWNGKTVISFRGTDQATPSWQNWTLGDFGNGWFTGAGLPGEKQAKLAYEFYKSVATSLGGYGDSAFNYLSEWLGL
jgi:hypothetical protein